MSRIIMNNQYLCRIAFFLFFPDLQNNIDMCVVRGDKMLRTFVVNAPEFEILPQIFRND